MCDIQFGDGIMYCSGFNESTGRFINIIILQGLQCVTYSLVMELFTAEYRTLAGCVVEGFWAGGNFLFLHSLKY